MNKFLFPIYAVVLGILLVLLNKNKNPKNSKLLLSFSGAFLLAITLFELLPDVYSHLEAKWTGLLIMCGIVLQIFLETLSKGAEHGHIHNHGTSHKFPWLLFISLCIHSVLEGFPIHQHNDMVYGVLIHKIPIAMIVTGFLVNAKFSKQQIIIFLTVFALMTPLGTWLSNEVPELGNYTIYINALVIGIFLHISTIILFESSEGHKFNIAKLLTIIAAVVIAYFI
ncbi:ZIP family metal transporter [Ichthyenterobacterium sp. W332]|uniref:ZIP family metal transporter n=1 Tax=Microcosmobacter mediterraneus TaxID=3075607 RepID=A0ABU2YGX2_9FLAO|nr:ZIP family metal transporter [Ichthyenterobacterium sp. W332]MDT0557419.1 ZIP family metal transporter [Ichthyenterobacterium sp. W332]